MKFTLENIEAAGKKYTGVEFYKLIQEFIKMDICINIYNLKDGFRVYENCKGDQIEVEFIKIPINNVETDKDLFNKILKNHQQGNTDFITFCNEVCEVGIYKWVISTTKMTCSYYDIFDNLVCMEKIPVGN